VGSVPESTDIAAIARRLYRGGGAATRLMQHHRHRVAPIRRLVDLVPPGSTVLDAGCGCGLLLNCLAASGRLRAGHGFDSSPRVIDTAREAAGVLVAERAGTAPTFECRPMEAGFPAGRFDVVCLIDVLHHVPTAHQESAFKEALSRVAPGGFMLYKDMCDAPAWRAMLNRLHDLVVARQWIHYVPIETVDGWARQCGMQIERSEWISMLWYGHELRVYRRQGDPS
jgi:2-polyprenyl-3-methyl-5-hydroxy-6-metoxy-1,4-benzoquinol methylase